MSIYKKILEFQKMGISLKKDWNNPHFKSKYVTLNEVLEKVKKPLNELWIVIVQTPKENGLDTMLYDTESEKSISCFMPYVEISTAQKLWSNNTYNRRYSLITLLWLEDDDDDGNKASEPKKQKFSQDTFDKLAVLVADDKAPKIEQIKSKYDLDGEWESKVQSLLNPIDESEPTDLIAEIANATHSKQD